MITIQTQMTETIRERARTEINEVANTIRTEIDLAHTSVDGYEREFKLPTTRYLGTYTLNITENILILRSEDEEYIYSTTVQNVTGQPQLGTNTITKNNGTIKLNK
jgi:hypothetical protein